MKCVIMAGGKGTRLHELAPELPKPMVDFCGKPIIEREILCLREQGIDDFFITVGYKSDTIMEYLGDGKNLDVKIDYFIEREPLGNAGALFYLREKLNESFLLINGDMLFQVDIQRFIRKHHESDAAITLFTHPNDHPYDSVLIEADNQDRVTKWITKENRDRRYYKNRTNAGIHILSPRCFDMIPDQMPVDLDRQVIRPLISFGEVVKYDSSEYVKDLGTPERFRQAEKDFKRGIVKAKCLNTEQKAFFLDRDGVINRYVGFLTDINQFELLPRVSEAIKELNRAGYLVIVVTNQPVIARGEVTYDELDMIHKKMESLLGDHNAYIDALYFCPHHPDKGFEGEVSELKMECECRKPKPGMLLKAAKDYHINLKKSWMVGDEKVDIEAGRAAGTGTVLISDEKHDFGQDITSSFLFAAVEVILKNEKK